MENFELLRGKRIFITGHTGFKGSWLSTVLVELGAIVRGFSLPNENNELHNILGIDLETCFGDIRNANQLSDSISDFRPEVVFHLAAQAIVSDSYSDPVNTFSTNVLGSVNLLEAVRHCDSVKALVFVTSDKCYENNEWVWGYRENDRLGGHDPYSASKAAAEVVFSSYRRSFFEDVEGFGMASARAGNVIGGGDWSQNRIIPDAYKAASTGGILSLRNPNATRPWQHVLEPLSGYLLLATKLLEDPKRYTGAWNFGPEVSEIYTVEQVAEHFFEVFGKGDLSIEDFPNANSIHEANLLQLNCDKAKSLLGWSSRWVPRITIEETAKWYKAYEAGEDMLKFTRGQIEDYFSSTHD